MEPNEYDYLFKAVLSGATKVGKSSILLQFTDGIFKADIVSTIGVEFGTKIVKIKEKSIKVQMWDTAGQYKYRSITSAYFRNAHIILFVFDITSKESLLDIKNRYEEEKLYFSNEALLCLVGNKGDLVEIREVTDNEAE